MKSFIFVLLLISPLITGCKILPHSEHRDPAPVEMVSQITDVAYVEYQVVDVRYLEVAGHVMVECDGLKLNQYEYKHDADKKLVVFKRKVIPQPSGTLTIYPESSVPVGATYRIYSEVNP